MFNHENLKGRVAVVTGGGGVLCGGYGLLRSNAHWWQRVAVMLRPEAFPEDYSYQIRVIRDMLRASRPIGRGQDTEMMRYSMLFKRDGSIDREAYVDFMLTTIAHRYGWVIALIIAAVLIGLIAYEPVRQNDGLRYLRVAFYAGGAVHTRQLRHYGYKLAAPSLSFLRQHIACGEYGDDGAALLPDALRRALCGQGAEAPE